jgi:cytochrome c-type biogenesis protein
VLPILPIVIATSLQASRHAPIALAAGMSTSLVLLGLTVSAVGPALGLSDEIVSRSAALLMVAFGLFLLVPLLDEKFTVATTAISKIADAGITATVSNGLVGQFLGGALLGAVWSPCIGPTLGAAIALASQGVDLIYATLIMTSFALGVSTLVFIFSFATKSWLERNIRWMRVLSKHSKTALGGTFIIIGFGIFFQFNHTIDTWLINHLPTWLIDFSVIL